MNISISWMTYYWPIGFLIPVLAAAGLMYLIGYMRALDNVAENLRFKVTPGRSTKAPNGDITVPINVQSTIELFGDEYKTIDSVIETCIASPTETTIEKPDANVADEASKIGTTLEESDADAVDEVPEAYIYPDREEISWLGSAKLTELAHEVLRAYSAATPHYYGWQSLEQKFARDTQVWDDYYLEDYRTTNSIEKQILRDLSPATTCEILREYAGGALVCVDEIPEAERAGRAKQIGILGMGISPFVLHVLLEEHIYEVSQLISWISSTMTLDFGSLKQDAVKWRLVKRLEAFGFKSGAHARKVRPLTTAEEFAAEYFKIKNLTLKNRSEKLWFIKDLGSLDDRLEELLMAQKWVGCYGPYCGEDLDDWRLEGLQENFEFRLMFAGEETPEARSVIANEAGLEALRGRRPCSALIKHGTGYKVKRKLNAQFDSAELVECFRHSYYEGLVTLGLYPPKTALYVADNLVEQGWIYAPEEIHVDLETHCTYLDMCDRARTMLLRSGIQTVGQLVKCFTETRNPVYSLNNICGLGPTSRKRILADLKRRGFIEADD